MTHVWLNIELLYHRKGRDQCGPDCVEKASLFYLFIYCCTGFSIVVASRGLSPVVVQWLLMHRQNLKQWTRRGFLVVKGMLGPFMRWSGGLELFLGSLQGTQTSFHLVIRTMSMHYKHTGNALTIPSIVWVSTPGKAFKKCMSWALRSGAPAGRKGWPVGHRWQQRCCSR